MQPMLSGSQIKSAIRYVSEHGQDIANIPNDRRQALLRATEDQMCRALNLYASDFPDNYDRSIDINRDSTGDNLNGLYHIVWDSSHGPSLLGQALDDAYKKARQTLQGENITLPLAQQTIDNFFLSMLCKIISEYKDGYYHSHRYTWPYALNHTRMLYDARRLLITTCAPQALKAQLLANNREAMQPANNQEAYNNLLCNRWHSCIIS